MGRPLRDHAPHIGARLQQARERAGLLGKQLDRLAGKAPGHARIIETTGRASVDSLVAYATVLGLSLDYLVLARGVCPAKASIRSAIEKAERLAA